MVHKNWNKEWRHLKSEYKKSWNGSEILKKKDMDSSGSEQNSPGSACGNSKQSIPRKFNLLIYAHYYELASTGQLLRDLAEGLPAQFKVTVICVVPSYLGTVEDKYKIQKYYFENISGVDLIRVRVPEFQKSNKISRVKNILTYFFRAMRATGQVKKVIRKNKTEKIDFIIGVSQPPILGGLLAAWGKWRLGGHIIYWIQDCNPELITAVGYFKYKLFIWLLEKLDMFSCSQADLVVVPGRDMVATIKRRFRKHLKKTPKITVINNWIDETEVYPLETDHLKVIEFKKRWGLEDKFIFMYSGNLGNYYGLMELLKVIQKFSAERVVFAFIGDGAQKKNMKAYVKNNNMENVVFIPYQDKKELIYSLNAADVHWCVNAKGIKGISCPSKYYGIAAVGKPVLGILEEDTEIRFAVEESRGGLVCEPGDYKAIEKNIRWFIENAGSEEMAAMGKRGREYLEINLSRERSIQKFIDILMGIEDAGESC